MHVSYRSVQIQENKKVCFRKDGNILSLVWEAEKREQKGTTEKLEDGLCLGHAAFKLLLYKW